MTIRVSLVSARTRRLYDVRPRAMLCCFSVIAFLFSGSSLTAAQSQQPLHIFSAADSLDLPRDLNGFLFNPRWFGADTSQATKKCALIRSREWSSENCFDIAPNVRDLCEFRAGTGHLDRRHLVTTRPNCLSNEERQIVTLNEATQTLGLGLVCVTGSKTGKLRGHVNWFPVTAMGTIAWNSFSKGAQDHDVNMDFRTPKPNAVTWANGVDTSAGYLRAYHTEFYSAETIERVPDGPPSFWRTFRKHLLNGKAEKSLLNGRIAIINGLYGIDGVHGYHAELHPVYALAILTGMTRDSSRSLLREEWAVMFRNLGSEGDCSEGTLPLLSTPRDSSIQDFILDLGSFPAAAPPVLTLGPSWVSDLNYRPTKGLLDGNEASRRALVVFRHPRPAPAKRDYLFLGTVYVDWPATDTVAWKARFSGFTKSTDLRWAASLPALADDPSAEEPTKIASLPGRLRVDYTDSLKYFGDSVMLSTSIDSAKRLLVQKTPPWPLADTVIDYSACTDPAKEDPLCLSGKRFVVGVTWGKRFGFSPTLSLYSYANCCYREGEEKINNVVNGLTLLGARLDWRRDEFFPERHAGNSVVVDRTERSGWSIRLSPFLPPITFRIKDDVTIAPYTIGSAGLSWLEHDHGRLVIGWGVGLGLDLGRQELYIETQNAKRRGGYAGQLFWSIGYLLPFH